jgi:integrase/recombinase XerD
MTTTIILDHRGRMKPGQEGPVEVRITHDRKSYYIATGVKVRRSEFKNGEITGRYDCVELNALVRAIEKRTVTAFAQMLADGKTIDGLGLRRMVFAAAPSSPMGDDRCMFDWFEEQIELLTLKPGTKKHYITLLVRLREYGKLMAWGDLSAEAVVNFDAWLHRLPVLVSDNQRLVGGEERRISDASVYTYHKCLKALLNRAVLFDKIARNPYDKLRGRFSRGKDDTVVYLTDEEAKAVEALHPLAGSQMDAARDLFVFQMHTGLSYADTQAFDFTQYQQVGGRWVNIGHREKNDIQYITVLSEECLRIIAKRGMTLPKLDNADYNRCLKALGMAADIDKPLHSHMARHTFATHMLASGAKIENVSKMLGHTNIKQTQRYAKVLPESVINDFENAEKKKRR